MWCTDFETTTVVGAGLMSAVAGVSTTVTVNARDQYGNDLARGGDSKLISIILKKDGAVLKSKESLGPKIWQGEKDHGNGTYTYMYCMVGMWLR